MRVKTYKIPLQDEHYAVSIPELFAADHGLAQAYAIGKFGRDWGVGSIEPAQIRRFKNYEARKTLIDAACESYTLNHDEIGQLAAFLAGLGKESILFDNQSFSPLSPQIERKAADRRKERKASFAFVKIKESFASCRPGFSFDEVPPRAMNVVYKVLTQFFGLPPTQTYLPTLIGEEQIEGKLGERILVYGCNGHNFTFYYNANTETMKHYEGSKTALHEILEDISKHTASGAKLFSPEFFDKKLENNQPGINQIARTVGKATDLITDQQTPLNSLEGKLAEHNEQ